MSEETIEAKSDEAESKTAEEPVAPEATTQPEDAAKDVPKESMAEASKGVRIVRLPDAPKGEPAGPDAGKPVAVSPDNARRAVAVQRAREFNRARNVKGEKVGAGGMIFMCVAVGICVMLLLCMSLFVLGVLGRAFGG